MIVETNQNTEYGVRTDHNKRKVEDTPSQSPKRKHIRS